MFLSFRNVLNIYLLLDSLKLCGAFAQGSRSKSPTNHALPSDVVGDIDFASEEDHPVGFYVHIPYCRRRCRYCNFSIVPVGTNFDASSTSTQTSTSFDRIHSAYQADLLLELDLLKRKIRRQQQPCYSNDSVKKPIRLSSIYFGGGTPSLAPVGMIQAVLEEICGASFELAEDAEITIEMDPGTFTTEKLLALKQLGINRISLGIQSFDDRHLEAMGRVHRCKDIDAAVASISEVFGDEANYSIDLISGVPGLTLPGWIETLEKATSLHPRPSHMSVYDLQVEEGTVFGSWYGESEGGTSDVRSNEGSVESSAVSKLSRIPRLPTEEAVACMYKFCAGYLRAKGYEHYEVSSYAYRGDKQTIHPSHNQHRSKHNQIYWATSSSWYAVGLGATSYVNGQLQARPKTMADYHTWVSEEDTAETEKAGTTIEDTATRLAMNDEVDRDDWLTDIIMKRLRTSDGLDLKWIEGVFGEAVKDSICKGAKLGLELGMAIHVRTETSERLCLTDPDGFLYSNYIISSIFTELGYE